MSRAVTVGGFVVLVLAAVALQVAGIVTGRTATLGQALRRATRRPAARVVLLAAWLWTGWHVFVRRS